MNVETATMLAKLGAPDRFAMPEDYEIDGTGVYQTRPAKDGSGTVRVRVTYAPLIPTAVYEDPEGLQLLELAWLDQGRVVTRVVPRATAKSGRKLITALGDAGIPAIDADARNLERWLATVEATNRKTIPRRVMARWLGWQPDGTFISAHTPDRKVEPKYEDQAAALAAHHARGTVDEWRQGLKPLAALPVAQTPIYAAFGAALLDVCGVDSFTLDISGPSTRGKTTAAKCGLSVWADPSDQADGLFSWRTTMISVEKRLNLVRGMPVVIDETRVAPTPALIDEVVYQVPKNVGKARSLGWPSMLRWQTVLISTGEQSALSFTKHQGAAARVLSIQRAPFGVGTQDNGRAAVDVGRSCEQNYGVAGPAFVEALMTRRAQKAGDTRIINRHRELTELCRGETNMSGRRAPMLAVMVLAAELAHEFELIPFPPPEIAVWLDLFAAPDPTDNRPEMALDVIREYIASRGDHLWRPGEHHRQQPTNGWIGRTFKLDGQDTVAMLPQQLREALAKAGYVLDAVLPGWQEAGYLHKSAKPGDRSPYLHIRALGTPQPGGRPPKSGMYVFMPDAMLPGHDGSEDE